MTEKNKTLRDNKDDIRARLIKLAQAQKIISYGELVEKYGIHMSEDHHEVIGTLEDILCEISSAEHEQGRHLLSVLVVLKKSNAPGEGFYELASRLGKFKKGGDKTVFFCQELDGVYSDWRKN